MDIIPVIDVRHGLAVRAARGQRAEYRPLVTLLAQGSEPVAVALGLRSLFTLHALYVADLDGIEGRRRNAALAQKLSEALPGVQLWIDDGALPRQPDPRALASTRTGVTTVVGSESLTRAEHMDALATLSPDDYILSLDFREDGFLGPAALLQNAALWPSRVIVMTLARVGSGEGPDLARVREVVARAGARRVYAAGGVRNGADIESLKEAGAAGVLIASALHDGKVTAGELERLAGR
jgi:phosphoribosylformimino-5-aminoimidazole carboxamide ribotide isomerase